MDQLSLQSIEPLSGRSAHRQYPAAVHFKERSLEKLSDGVDDLLQVPCADSVGLCDYRDTPLDAEHLADGQMLHRLRHDALICRNHEHDGRYAAGSGQHIADEEAMAGNVDKADAEL